MPDGIYRSVRPVKDNLVVNIGAYLSKITNYQLKATLHRVLDIGRERYSRPFFLDAKFDAMIPSNLMNTDENCQEDGVSYGVYLVVRMRSKFVEWKDFKLPGEKGYIPKKIAKQVKKSERY